jgi:hypothetical protein
LSQRKGLRSHKLLFAVVAAAALTLGAVASFMTSRPEAPAIDGLLWPNSKVLTAFALEDHHHEAFTLDRLTGRWTLLFFGYTHCPDFCPTGLQTITQALTLLGADAFDHDVVRLRYRLADGDELRYEFRSGRVTEVELRHEGDAVHRVAVSREGGGELPKEATYRNLASFSELKVTVETVERVDSHPSDIWYLDP